MFFVCFSLVSLNLTNLKDYNHLFYILFLFLCINYHLISFFLLTFLLPVLSLSSGLRQVLYNMAIWTNETEPPGPSPMAPPSVNVSLTGTVPQHPITFRLDLPCLGLRSAEVDVILNINVTSPRPRQPPTVLYFMRRKICLEGECRGTDERELVSRKG